jgi:hypothetical protein
MPWPFLTWGLNLLEPFTPTTSQLKHLIVVVDYFTKWIKLKPLSSIASVRAQNFASDNLFFDLASRQKSSLITGDSIHR